jgi:hypothetical protein
MTRRSTALVSLRLVIALGLALDLVSCGVATNYESYTVAKDGDLLLTAVSHPHGYGQTECFVCHNNNNIHRVDRIGSAMFPYARPLVEQSGLASCRGCHGPNGT